MTPTDRASGGEAARVNGDMPAQPWQTYIGLTKREWFAGLAMQGLCAAPDYPLPKVAREAVEQADALLAALAAPEAGK